MTTAFKSRKSPAARRRFQASRLGWLGIDVGTRAIKLAQVERSGSGNGWRLATHRVIAFPDDQPVNAASIADGLIGRCLRELLPSSANLPSRSTACVLPSSVTDMRSLQLPDGEPRELRQLVVGELESGDDTAEPREFDFWKTPGASGDTNGLVSVTVLSVARRTALGLAESLRKLGLNCLVLDSQPCALARAVRLADAKTHSSVAALDWGFSTPTLTLVVDGQPVFARTLRDCGLRIVLEAVAQRLNLSPQDAHQLLTTYGFGLATAEASPSQVQQTLTQLAAAPARELFREIDKTLSFLRQQYKELVPTRIWLFGGGALIPNAAAWIAQTCGIETNAWRLPPARSRTGTPARREQTDGREQDDGQECPSYNTGARCDESSSQDAGSGNKSARPPDLIHAVLGPAIALSALGVDA
jgi:Tfp pilus assembly PilM family ATPase